MMLGETFIILMKTRLMHEWHLPAACPTAYVCHTLYVFE